MNKITLIGSTCSSPQVSSIFQRKSKPEFYLLSRMVGVGGTIVYSLICLNDGRVWNKPEPLNLIDFSPFDQVMPGSKIEIEV